MQRTLRFSSFVDLGLLSQAFGSSSITLTREASELYLQRLSVVSKEELANLAQGPGSGSDLVNSLAAALERVAEGSLQLLSPSVDGELLLASIRPLTLELCARRAVRPRTAAAVLGQHAHFSVRDQELFEALEDEEHSSSDISATLAGRLLRPLGALGHPSEHFLQSVDKSLSIWGKRRLARLCVLLAAIGLCSLGSCSSQDFQPRSKAILVSQMWFSSHGPVRRGGAREVLIERAAFRSPWLGWRASTLLAGISGSVHAMPQKLELCKRRLTEVTTSAGS